jgi:hypothetical protein
MGVDFSDYDNDGWPDVFIDALGAQKYALFRNAKGSFEYVTSPTGIGAITLHHSTPPTIDSIRYFCEVRLRAFLKVSHPRTSATCQPGMPISGASMTDRAGATAMNGE